MKLVTTTWTYSIMSCFIEYWNGKKCWTQSIVVVPFDWTIKLQIKVKGSWNNYGLKFSVLKLCSIVQLKTAFYIFSGDSIFCSVKRRLDERAATKYMMAEGRIQRHCTLSWHFLLPPFLHLCSVKIFALKRLLGVLNASQWPVNICQCLLWHWENICCPMTHL